MRLIIKMGLSYPIYKVKMVKILELKRLIKMLYLCILLSKDEAGIKLLAF